MFEKRYYVPCSLPHSCFCLGLYSSKVDTCTSNCHFSTAAAATTTITSTTASKAIATATTITTTNTAAVTAYANTDSTIITKF